MNYEKKYKEALERMKSWAKGEHPECFSEAQKTAEFIFPELKESEDERMLREIKRYIKEQGDKPTGLPNGTVAVSDMIAWLEKQKEPDWAHSQNENEDNYIIRCLINGLRFYCADNEDATWGTDKFHMKVTDIINWLEEQKTFTEECERISNEVYELLKKKYEL